MFTQLIAVASLATAALATPLASRYFYAPSNGTQLNYQGNTQQCLSVNNGYAAQGTDVELVSCFGATDPSIALQLWTLTRNAPTKVQLTLPGSGDQELCLDFGSNPANGGEVKVWECLDVPQQMFWYTSDNRLSLYNAGFCTDVVKGSGPTPTKPNGTIQNVQVWKCTDNDEQQVFTSSLSGGNAGAY